MVFIKEHKLLVILISVCTILLVIFGFCIKILFFTSDSNDIYGSRLKGIENVEITASKINDIKTKILNNKNSNNIVYRLDGRLIKFFIEVKTETDELSVEAMLNEILDNFEEEEKAFYDFEVFITNEAQDQELYPMIAYKHRSNNVFTITRKEVRNNEE